MNAFLKEVVRLCIPIHVESTFILDVKKWTNMIVGQLSPSIHVDSADPVERLQSEDVSLLAIHGGGGMGRLYGRSGSRGSRTELR